MKGEAHSSLSNQMRNLLITPAIDLGEVADGKRGDRNISDAGNDI